MGDIKLWDQRSQNYNNLQWVGSDQLLADVIAPLKSFKAPDKIIELGCGSGKIISAIKNYYSYFPFACENQLFYGVDLSQEMLNKIENKEIMTCACDIKDIVNKSIPFKYDLVVMRMVLHHLGDDLNGYMDAVCDLVAPGGMLIICEGVSPAPCADSFYENMFSLKEDRIRICERSVVNMLHDRNMTDITNKYSFLENCSINNWLENGGANQDFIKAIKHLHLKSNNEIKKAYRMSITNDDILMTWKFVTISAIKKAY